MREANHVIGPDWVVTNPMALVQCEHLMETLPAPPNHISRHVTHRCSNNDDYIAMLLLLERLKHFLADS